MEAWKKRDGEVLEKQKNGKTVEKKRYLDSEKIGKKTSKSIKNAETVEDLKKGLIRLLDLENGGQ